MKDIIEIDNIITQSYQDQIESQVTEKTFPWYYNPTMVADQILQHDIDYNLSGFHHFLYEDAQAVSPFFNFLYPLVLSIQDNVDIPMKHSIERMRLNMSLRYKGSTRDHHLPHIDSLYEHWNAIYYVNDSDGDTVIFEETNETFDSNDLDYIENHTFTPLHRVTPKKGKLLVFNGKYYHASSFCQQSRHRIVLNMNFADIKKYINTGTDVF